MDRNSKDMNDRRAEIGPDCGDFVNAYYRIISRNLLLESSPVFFLRFGEKP